MSSSKTFAAAFLYLQTTISICTWKRNYRKSGLIQEPACTYALPLPCVCTPVLIEMFTTEEGYTLNEGSTLNERKCPTVSLQKDICYF